MNDIAPASCLADRTRCFLTLLQAYSILALGERYFVNLYLASRFPDHEIWYISARIAESVSKSKAFGLTSVLLNSRVTVEQKRELSFLKGFTLDRFTVFARDCITQIGTYWRDTPDITCWWFPFECHACLLFSPPQLGF